jgi:hypothetical protein
MRCMEEVFMEEGCLYTKYIFSLFWSGVHFFCFFFELFFVLNDDADDTYVHSLLDV